MRKIFVLVIGLFLSTSIFAKEFNVDTAHSYVGFKVKHMEVSNFKGNFQKYSGVIDIDTDSLKINKMVAEINTSSIFTANNARDGHLKNSDFFDIEKFPNITFEMTNFIQDKKDKKEGKIEGYLTIKGVKKLVVLDSEINGIIENDGKDRQRVGLSLEGKIDRFDFGINYDSTFAPGKMSVGGKVKFDIELELIEK